ncbi:hypothetical protein BGZ65_002203 [Modicella reniformis]|uniref:Uncharacterized protein n=1 Tax=Modicella reniformis TaxID=1440133 RepID=A0A9P6MM62_9FUNG|nr:hypothetical protein BGZ65_002203 [Modicella reniformis]
MIIETRTATILFALTVGGLLLTIARYKGSSSQPLTFELLNQVADDLLKQVDGQNNNNNDYNYCQAQRPALNTFPEPKFKGSTLVNSQLFIRHGDRTPSAVNPRDLDLTWECAKTNAYAFTGIGTDEAEKAPFHYANVVAHQIITIPQKSPFATQMWKGSCLPGQLTPVGAMQHRRLGTVLRQIYVDKFKLLPATFDPEAVYIRSTEGLCIPYIPAMRLSSADVWRTKQSAENLMAGMYGIQSPSSTTPPPVLQIHTLPIEIDYLTMNTNACPRLSKIKSEMEKASQVLKRLKADTVEFKKELINILGVETFMSGYMDTVLPRVCHGKPLQCLPNEANEESKCITKASVTRILEVIGVETTETFRDAEGITEVLRLGIGPFVDEIKQNLLHAKANGKVRFSFYSGHDTTILPLLGVLDSLDMRWPPYASSILVELWRTPRDEHYIRVLYNGVVLQTKSKWCDLEWCPFEAFIGQLEKFAITDVTTMCQNPK